MGAARAARRSTARRGRCAPRRRARGPDPVGCAGSGFEPELRRSVPARRGAPPASACTRGSATGSTDYGRRHDRLAGGTSELSPYLHFGCLSARELAERVRERGGGGAGAYVRQLAWRDFYAHVLLHHPGNARGPFQSRYETLGGRRRREGFDAWKEGRTGFPLVDAAMRQLRARAAGCTTAPGSIVGSFLTKDLHLDWRQGEAHFMRYLLDGDEANNNGNWQWISSVGIDPAPPYAADLQPGAASRRATIPTGTTSAAGCPSCATCRTRA